MTDTSPGIVTLLPEQHDLIVRLTDLLVRIENMSMEAEGLKAELRHYPPGVYDTGQGARFRIVASRRFNPEAALDLVPAELRDLCMVRTIDPAKVKQYLAPALVDSCMVETGKPRVSIL